MLASDGGGIHHKHPQLLALNQLLHPLRQLLPAVLRRPRAVEQQLAAHCREIEQIKSLEKIPVVARQ